MLAVPSHLVQGTHSKDRSIVSLDGLDERGVLPDVDISIGSSSESQVLRPTITSRHHGLLPP